MEVATGELNQWLAVFSSVGVGIGVGSGVGKGVAVGGDKLAY